MFVSVSWDFTGSSLECNVVFVGTNILHVHLSHMGHGHYAKDDNCTTRNSFAELVQEQHFRVNHSS